MDHPNIATVLDAGATPSGRPFFVMEYVDGLPLTQFCERKRLTLRTRLGLFIEICSAVQHAHQRGVIHRDLKPSNILVIEADSRPQPKVIDFGLARAIGHESAEGTLLTRTGQVLGTPGYMAPEQAAGSADVDPRADVYALGAILYELITGDASFERTILGQAGIEEILRLIREAEPARPSRRLASLARREGTRSGCSRTRRISTLARRVRGNLDWIVMKALEKDRNRRYDGAGELSADVRHYLAREPVVACSPSAVYRMARFVRRHHRFLATAALVALSLLLGRL
jgi:serine/threonine protein kinase